VSETDDRVGLPASLATDAGGDAPTTPNGRDEELETGEYCRAIEDHLTRVNGGHLVRIVGPGFDLVRGWASAAIPLSVVFRAIERKVERSTTASRRHPGRPRRPLRIEFCETDVLELFDAWRRAVGVPASAGIAPAGNKDDPPAPRRAASLGKHLDRVVERLTRVMGLVNLPDALRDRLALLVHDLNSVRDGSRGTRGSAREELKSRLDQLDLEMMAAARAAAPADLLETLTHDATRDLAPFRGRLVGEPWTRAVDVTVDRLLRDRFGLPTIQIQ
jgi:hypothetical protein